MAVRACGGLCGRVAPGLVLPFEGVVLLLHRVGLFTHVLRCSAFGAQTRSCWCHLVIGSTLCA